MKIAIQAADLDHSRIDGTRVYIFNLLKHFGRLDSGSDFALYHRDDFNPELAPPNFANYAAIRKPFPFLWTQTRLAYELWWNTPDVLWMPMSALPIIRRKKMKTVITIHDLAFKYFPEHFPAKDLRKLNFFADYSIRAADKIIAISEATKKDILKLYPGIKAEKVRVIYHGFSPDVFSQPRDAAREAEIKKELGIAGSYIIYIGAIQPRKNLNTLIKAFEMLKNQAQNEDHPDDLELVIVGEKAWLSEGTVKMARQSRFADAIKMPGRLKFEDVGHLCRGAGVFVFPPLYEGFGIPVLEAMAARVPVICADNSSLPEVGGEACLYFKAADPEDLAQKIKHVLGDGGLRAELVAKGQEQIKKFSWEKCAQETLDYLKN
ncbi:MAG: glycosyltransferase family 1 protein [Candidatus Moranbacteria bacterium]|nr:glycosyltransferase family 1 protein [Candidatus Moranbacteria bacterium]